MLCHGWFILVESVIFKIEENHCKQDELLPVFSNTYLNMIRFIGSSVVPLAKSADKSGLLVIYQHWALLVKLKKGS